MDSISLETGARLKATDALFARVRTYLEEESGKATAGAVNHGKIGKEFELLQLELNGIYCRFAMVTAPAALKLLDARTRDAGIRDMRIAASSQDFDGELRVLHTKLEAVLQQTRAENDPETAKGQKSTRTKLTTSEHTYRVLCETLERFRGQAQSDSRASRAPLALAAASNAVENVDCEICAECETELVVDTGRSEARCPECQKVVELHGCVYEDAQFYSQEGQRTKSGCFSPNRHYAVWIDHILAIEPESEIGDGNDPDSQTGEKLIVQLRVQARKTNRYIMLLTINDVRAMLKAIGRTDLYRNASLILKKLTGQGPPMLSEDKRVKGEMMFSQANQMRASLGIPNNRNYYPFYICKIYDLILAPDDPDRLLLWYIHLQGEDTLDNNDREWRMICGPLGWEWRPTNPAKIATYRTIFASPG